jgi:hypothetical protein
LILSREHRFIFLKTTKTAGTSIEIALSEFCGDGDIITPLAPEDETTRSRLGYRGPQNHVAPLSDYRLRDYARLVVRRRRKLRYYNHMTAREVRGYVGDDTWNTYYKFCFERNPWDRVVSHYYWRCRTEPRPTISEYIDSGTPLLLRKRGLDLYSIDGEIAVDRIYRFENLMEELSDIANKLGLSGELELPRAKSDSRPAKQHYRDILDDDARDKIGQLFSKEINLMGYKF